MATKDERLEMRVSKADRELIEEAANQLDERVSDFTRNAALTEAHRVLARADKVLMPVEQFDALLASLGTADEAPVLREAFARSRRFNRG